MLRRLLTAATLGLIVLVITITPALLRTNQ